MDWVSGCGLGRFGPGHRGFSLHEIQCNNSPNPKEKSTSQPKRKSIKEKIWNYTMIKISIERKMQASIVYHNCERCDASGSGTRGRCLEKLLESSESLSRTAEGIFVFAECESSILLSDVDVLLAVELANWDR